MLKWITIIFCCQLAGETLVRLGALPVPGPVAGMVLLFCGLAAIKSVPKELGTVSSGLLSHLSLLFVPAGTGIIVHLPLLRDDAIPVSIALVLSTLATVVVTGWMMQLLMRRGEPPTEAGDNG
ncbi:MAG: CidA/LrgA family protein [Pseudomonadota bacterium]